MPSKPVVNKWRKDTMTTQKSSGIIVTGKSIVQNLIPTQKTC